MGGKTEKPSYKELHEDLIGEGMVHSGFILEEIKTLGGQAESGKKGGEHPAWTRQYHHTMSRE